MRLMVRALMMMCCCAACLVSFAAPTAAEKLASSKTKISLADARSRIGKAIANPVVMKAIMQHLSAEDQKRFVADVNMAISKLPASPAERNSIFVAINRAALQSAEKGNVATLVAESFATVSPEALPALSESLGSDLMNRATDRNNTYSDAQFIRIAQIVMAKVNPRTAEVDNSDVRSAFAALMFARGSNSQSEEIITALVKTLPEKVQNTAKTEWFPSALSEGKDKNYESLLASADVDTANTKTVEHETHVNTDLTPVLELRVSGIQLNDSLLADIVGASTDPLLKMESFNPVVDAVVAPIQYQLPNLGTGAPFDNPADQIGVVIEESRGYQWQTTH